MIDPNVDVLDDAVATVKHDDVVDGRLVEQLIGRVIGRAESRASR